MRMQSIADCKLQLQLAVARNAGSSQPAGQSPRVDSEKSCRLLLALGLLDDRLCQLSTVLPHGPAITE